MRDNPYTSRIRDRRYQPSQTVLSLLSVMEVVGTLIALVAIATMALELSVVFFGIAIPAGLIRSYRFVQFYHINGRDGIDDLSYVDVMKEAPMIWLPLGVLGFVAFHFGQTIFLALIVLVGLLTMALLFVGEALVKARMIYNATRDSL